MYTHPSGLDWTDVWWNQPRAPSSTCLQGHLALHRGGTETTWWWCQALPSCKVLKILHFHSTLHTALENKIQISNRLRTACLGLPVAQRTTRTEGAWHNDPLCQISKPHCCFRDITVQEILLLHSTSWPDRQNVLCSSWDTFLSTDLLLESAGSLGEWTHDPGSSLYLKAPFC